MGVTKWGRKGQKGDGVMDRGAKSNEKSGFGGQELKVGEEGDVERLLRRKEEEEG